MDCMEPLGKVGTSQPLNPAYLLTNAHKLFLFVSGPSIMSSFADLGFVQLARAAKGKSFDAGLIFVNGARKGFHFQQVPIVERVGHVSSACQIDGRWAPKLDMVFALGGTMFCVFCFASQRLLTGSVCRCSNDLSEASAAQRTVSTCIYLRFLGHAMLAFHCFIF